MLYNVIPPMPLLFAKSGNHGPAHFLPDISDTTPIAIYYCLDNRNGKRGTAIDKV